MIISNISLQIRKISETSPNVTAVVKYRVTIELGNETGGINEKIRILGRDPGSDTERFVFPPNPAPPFQIPAAGVGATFDRQHEINVPKQRMNEDPELTATGAETSDEILAKIELTYGPTPQLQFLATALTNQVAGAWK